MSKKNPKLSPEEKLQQENAFLKLKLIAENDAQFFNGERTETNPKLENEWLNYIVNYEQLYRNANKISLYQFIGSPAFAPDADLNDEEISSALEDLFKIMGENDVVLDCICEYEDRLIYKFITEELFNYEVEDIRMKGMTTNFIYEEFHPNHEYDIKDTCSNFLNALLHRKWEEYDANFLASEIQLHNGTTVKKELFKQQIEMFQEFWHSIDVEREEIIKVIYNLEEEEAYAEIGLAFKASGPDDEAMFAGKGKIYLLQEYGYWSIKKVTLPGFNSL